MAMYEKSFSGSQLAVAVALSVALPCLLWASATVPAAPSAAYSVARPAASIYSTNGAMVRAATENNRASAQRVASARMGAASEPIPEVVLQTTRSSSPEMAAAWAFASSIFAMLALALHKAAPQKRYQMPQFLDTVVHHDRIAVAATTGEKGTSKRHAFALVVTNKGGGHGEIGLHLALALKAKGLEVQVINDNGGKEITSKPPFSKYDQLKAAGIEVTFADLSKPDALQEATCPPAHLCRAYDYIFDNENVCQKDVADLAASCGAFYTYVSSGGMYVPGSSFPMKESTPTKGASSNAQKKHEEYVLSPAVRQQLKGCAFFRPQYIVGPYTNKRDYLDWFFDRLTRNLPIPLPAPGTQTTTITDARDVANMIASVVGKENEIAEAEKANPELGPVFNCASDEPVSLFRIVIACGAACGKSEAETLSLVRLYNPALAKDAPSGGKFPFRATNFDVGVDKAKVVLEWEAEFNDFDVVAAAYYEGYKALGLHQNNPKLDRSFDEYILARI